MCVPRDSSCLLCFLAYAEMPTRNSNPDRLGTHRAGGIDQALQRRKAQRVAQRSFLKSGQSLDPCRLCLLKARCTLIISSWSQAPHLYCSPAGCPTESRV